ncbi:thioredoxin-disulfide reductase [bacterium]|nr:MAG: thioredoxin-disulfide reductase [bacterium]
MSKVYDVLIIGSGPAAYTAAIYTARAALKTIIFAGDVAGGQLLLTSEVENFPGFRDGVMGPDLMEEMKAQAKRFEVEMVDEFIDAVEPGIPHTVQVRNGKKVQAKTIIIATGAQARWLGLENETRLMAKGISACATCDGYFFQGKHVVVVGGGDTAMEEALTLTKFADKVTVVHRRGELRASKIMQERAKSHPKIEFIWHSAVTDVLGENMVSGVEITNLQTDKKQIIDCAGLFVAIGHIPATNFIKGIIELDNKGYVVVRDNVFTNIDGIFAAGDVADKRYRQAITAAGDGCRAALEAEHFLGNQG